SAPRRLARPSPLFSLHDPATTEIYTLSLHDALPIYEREGVGRPHGGLKSQLGAVELRPRFGHGGDTVEVRRGRLQLLKRDFVHRSEEHTSELQSRENLVCRLLLEKKKKTRTTHAHHA